VVGIPKGIAVRLAINGAELWFDVEGTALVPDGPAMRGRPVVLVLRFRRVEGVEPTNSVSELPAPQRG
jgi:hypothetical protein